MNRPDTECQHKLKIVKVDSRPVLKRFITLPWSIYRTDPVWVPPLIMERLDHFSSKNPFFKHAEANFWLAFRGNKPVGRISAQLDNLSLRQYNRSCGSFGLLEAEDNQETFQGLIQTAEDWLYKHGIGLVLGPLSLSINDEAGLLIQGFETSPSIMMGHARPYYASRLEQCGYTKQKDLLAYRLNVDYSRPEVLRNSRIRKSNRMSLHPVRKKNLVHQADILRDIFNDAWQDNWGFVPFTREEFQNLAKQMKHILKDDFVHIANIDGQPAAMIVLLPNINEIISDLNGRLTPFGWHKLLWRLFASQPQTGRVPLFGIRKKYQQTLLGSKMIFQLIKTATIAAKEAGIKDVELSWILEDNQSLQHILQALGANSYKRYRIYGKQILGNQKQSFY